MKTKLSDHVAFPVVAMASLPVLTSCQLHALNWPSVSVESQWCYLRSTRRFRMSLRQTLLTRAVALPIIITGQAPEM